ncbi:MAG: hypothetical protein GXP55_01045 [Deltaproteobacteria bacterium]|nr:hypothetical protein [Deltaproteobacteria bacterium]
MSETPQSLFEAFAAGFLRPLLGGQRVQLTRLLGPGLVPHFSVAQTADSSVDAAIYERLHQRASRHAPVRALGYPEPETRAFAMALHDLIALTDPMLDRVFARGARPKIVAFVEALLAATGAPRTRGEVLARHVLCDRALALRRRDVVVTNWAYTYRFFGRPVPRNVVAMPRLRRVKQKAEERELLAIFSQLDTEEMPLHTLLRGLLARSPFTRIARFSLDATPLFDVSTLAMLEDASLRQGLITELRQAHESKLMARLGGELWKLQLRRDVPPRLLRVAVVFVLELGLRLMLRRDPPDFVGAPSSFELGLALSLPAAALQARKLWPELALDDAERVTTGAQIWAAWAGDVPLREAKNMIAEATSEADLERAS